MNYDRLKTKNGKLSTIPWLFLALMIFVLSIAILFVSIPRSLAASVTMEVYQQEGHKVLGKNTLLDIFNDPKLDGKKLIHPFSKGSYVFAVYNNSNSDPLPYSLTITGENPENVPLVFSLQKNGAYIYGGEGKANMKPFSEYKVAETLLSGRKTDLYTIKWEWETESDVIDTAIGNIGTQLYTLKINATGTIPDTDIPETGNHTNVFTWLAILSACVLLLLILPLYKRRKDEAPR